jgi:hypothetical protein
MNYAQSESPVSHRHNSLRLWVSCDAMCFGFVGMGVLWLWTGPRAVFVALGVGAGVCVYVGESGSCGMWESRVHVGCGRS